MCSAVRVDGYGRRIVVQTTAGEVGLPLGTRFLLLGNELPCAERGIRWTGERTGFRNPFVAPRRTNRDPIPLDVR